jgi:glycosyltransferase involved in cell wall biosynthesis
MKKLLVLAFWMPPILLPRSIQVARTLNSLAVEEGWTVTLVTADLGSMRYPGFVDTSLWNLYPASQVAGRYDVPLWPEDEGVLAFWRRRRMGRQLVAQPPMEVWRKRATPLLTSLAERGDYAAMISFAAPWEDHEIAMDVAKATGIPWLAHFADPWVDNPFLKKSDPARMAALAPVERKVIERADRVIFVSDSTRDLVMGKYPAEWAGKADVVPHGYDLAALNRLPPPPPRRGRRLRLVYTGNFYGDRNADLLLEALALLKATPEIIARLDIRLVGAADRSARLRAAELGVDGEVTFIGQMEYMDSMYEGLAADALLVIDAPMEASPFLPSKLIDYLPLRRPILGVVPADGESAKLLRRLECPVVSAMTPEAVAESLRDLILLSDGEGLAVSSAFLRVAEEFCIKRTVRGLSLAIENAIRTREFVGGRI